MLALRDVIGGALARIVLIGGAGTLAYLAVLLPSNGLLAWTWAQLRPARAEPSG
jgi:hypothetical protein